MTNPFHPLSEDATLPDHNPTTSAVLSQNQDCCTTLYPGDT
ncbi:hypothetical protein [Pedobacter gandavensis]|nr:hypothetical protein [Pedobacter gandavensis]